MIRDADAVRFIVSVIEPHLKCSETKIEDVLNDNIRFRSLLRTALNNRVLFAFCSTLLNSGVVTLESYPFITTLLSKIRNEGEKWLDKLHKTLELISLTSERTNISMLLIKTLRCPQDITFDVDILIKSKEDFHKIESCFKALFSIERARGGYVLFPKNTRLLSIDVYYDFIKFGNVRDLNPEFVWSNVRPTQFADWQFLVPSPEAEIIMPSSQIVFQNRFLTLSDLLHLKSLIQNNEKTLKWGDVMHEVSRHGWEKEFVKLISVVHGIYLNVWKQALEIPIKPERNLEINLPRFLGPTSLLPFRLKRQGAKAFKPFLLRDCWYYLYSLIKYRLKSRIPIYRDWIDLDE